MRKIAALIAIVFALTLVTTFSIALDKGPESMKIERVKKKKPPVEFKHHEHQKRVKEDCTVCHHKSEKGAQPEACSKCHKAKKDGDTPGFKKAMHGTCKDCHKKEKAAGNTKAPTKCKGCHKK